MRDIEAAMREDVNSRADDVTPVSVSDATEASELGKAGPKRVRTWHLRDKLYSLIAVLLVLAMWETFVVIRDVVPIVLPAPSAILMRVVEMTLDGSLLIETGLTVMRILWGFAIAVVTGVGLGLLMGMYRALSNVADTFIAALYPLPKIALIPLLIIWLGTGEAYKIAISALSAFFPIVINTYQGVREVDIGLIKTAKNLGASRRQLQLKVIIPGSLPFILAGFRLGMGVAFILVVAAEMVAGSNGLGHVLFYSGQILRTDRVFAVLIVLAILGWLITRIQQRIDRAIAPWARVNV